MVGCYVMFDSKRVPNTNKNLKIILAFGNIAFEMVETYQLQILF